MSSALAARSALNARLASTFARRSLRPLAVHGASFGDMERVSRAHMLTPFSPHANIPCTHAVSTLPRNTYTMYLVLLALKLEASPTMRMCRVDVSSMRLWTGPSDSLRKQRFTREL